MKYYDGERIGGSRREPPTIISLGREEVARYGYAYRRIGSALLAFAESPRPQNLARVLSVWEALRALMESDEDQEAGQAAFQEEKESIDG
jgi:hypothetical protein